MMLQADRSLCIRALRSQKAPGAANWFGFFYPHLSPRDASQPCPWGSGHPQTSCRGSGMANFPSTPHRSRTAAGAERLGRHTADAEPCFPPINADPSSWLVPTRDQDSQAARPRVGDTDPAALPAGHAKWQISKQGRGDKKRSRLSGPGLPNSQLTRHREGPG